MDLMQIIRIAMRALARNKLRSSLTMLGIIIGVGAVIAMVSVGQGAQEQAQQQIAAMGSNMLFVGAGTVTRGGMHMGWGATKTLVYADMQAILREVPTIASAAPSSATTATAATRNRRRGRHRTVMCRTLATPAQESASLSAPSQPGPCQPAAWPLACGPI